MSITYRNHSGCTWFVGRTENESAYVFGQQGPGSDPEVYEDLTWNRSGCEDSAWAIARKCQKAGYAS